MADFVLLGADSDETRLLLDRASGYSTPLPGHPTIASVQQEIPRYDAVVTLGDVKAEYGFRIEDRATHTDPEALARQLTSAVAAPRVREDWKIVPTRVSELLRPPGATGGAEVTYPLRGFEETTVEHLWVALQPNDHGLWVLYRTTRYRAADFVTIKWHHLRTSFSGHHHWDPSAPRSQCPTIWPASQLGLPTATLDLTEDAWREARAKAHDVGVVTSAQVVKIVEILNNVAEEDFPPALIVPEIVTELHTRRLGDLGDIGEVLIRNVRQCKTAFDFRAWAWQCAWAIGNRTSLGSAT
ncbi:MAG: hypothetical protein AB7T06_46530 [Kofleriaceae bacterium]